MKKHNESSNKIHKMHNEFLLEMKMQMVNMKKRIQTIKKVSAKSKNKIKIEVSNGSLWNNLLQNDINVLYG